MIAGIDIGSRSIELVCQEGGETVLTRRSPTTFNPLSRINAIVEGLEISRIVATGYGRNLAAQAFSGRKTLRVEAITEIKAYSLGTAALAPLARTVLDIGGQDSKAIRLGENGRVLKFEMNDRCAAGTGKFLEHSANVFQVPIEEFGGYALKGDKALTINSMCAVFAETEATSLMARGNKPENIALGLHASIVKRTINMLGRVGLATPLAFAGGVAKNPCIVKLLADALNEDVIVPEEPDMAGAYGAALFAMRES